jgi:hypothetical protein
MSHHSKDDKAAKKSKPAADKPVKRDDPAQEDDTEGHNLLAMSDYYVQARIGRQEDIERHARQQALVKEAKSQKPQKR